MLRSIRMGAPTFGVLGLGQRREYESFWRALELCQSQTEWATSYAAQEDDTSLNQLFGFAGNPNVMNSSRIVVADVCVLDPVRAPHVGEV